MTVKEKEALRNSRQQAKRTLESQIFNLQAQARSLRKSLEELQEGLTKAERLLDKIDLWTV